jgi:hypothetical protein
MIVPVSGARTKVDCNRRYSASDKIDFTRLVPYRGCSFDGPKEPKAPGRNNHPADSLYRRLCKGGKACGRDASPKKGKKAKQAWRTKLDSLKCSGGKRFSGNIRRLIAIRRGKYSRDTFTRRRRAWAGTIISGVYRNGAGPSGKSDQRLTEKVQQFVYHTR